jgi:hypothetical protein
MADISFMYDCANRNFREACRLYSEHYPQSSIDQTSPANERIWALCSMGVETRKASLSTCSWYVSQEYRDPVCEELQLLKLSAFPLAGEFSMNSHFTLTTSTPTDHSAMAVFCQWLLAKLAVNTVCLLMRRNSQGTVLRTLIIPIAWWMTISTPAWHQDINVDFPSMSVRTSYVINSQDQLSYITDQQVECSFLFFMLNDLPVVLEHVPLHQQKHMWFIHDWAPRHFLRLVRQHLNQTFGEQWVGHGGLSTHLHDPLTLILWIFGWKDTQKLWYIQRRSML